MRRLTRSARSSRRYRPGRKARICHRHRFASSTTSTDRLSSFFRTDRLRPFRPTLTVARPLEELAPDRHRLERLLEAERERVGSFDAWEEDNEIVVSGVDDLPIEQWDPRAGTWTALGIPREGRLAPPSDTRPHLIRIRE